MTYKTVDGAYTFIIGGSAMNIDFSQKYDLIEDNYRIIKKNYKLAENVEYIYGAELFAEQNREVNPDTLLECRDILKHKVKALSALGSIRNDTALTCKMALSSDPVGYLERTAEALKELKKHSKMSSELSITTAILFSDLGLSSDAVEKYADISEKLYKAMKRKHPFLTDTADSHFISLLALTGRENDAVIDETEELYKLAKEDFPNNAAQTISFVLALSKDVPQAKYGKLKELYQRLKEAKHKFPKDMNISILAAVSLADISAEQLTNLLISVDENLMEVKGFKRFSISAAERLVYAAQLIISECCNDDKLLGSVIIHLTEYWLMNERAAVAAATVASM